jgi:hypothetical protein
MSDKQQHIATLKALAKRLSYLASVFALAWGQTPAYHELLAGLNDVNAIISALRNPNIAPIGEYSPPR